jgi:hypothetical protein
MAENFINLGDEVEDTVSGFKGIAISRHIYLQGCDRIGIQPPMKKDGTLPDAISFDEPQLKVTKPKKVERKAAQKNPGGPEKYKDHGRFSG